MLPFQKEHKEYRTWLCPTMCGCAVKIETVWRLIPDLNLATLYLLKNPEVSKEEAQSAVLSEGAVEILGQCEAHPASTPQELFDSLKHYSGQAWTPDTCNCEIHYVKDKREDPATVELIPVKQPVRTRCCEVHSHLTDHNEHHATVKEENHRKNNTVREVSSLLGKNPDDVKWGFNENRELLIDIREYGTLDKTRIKNALLNLQKVKTVE